MFDGILHNLNGVNQAFSLQSSLLKSMFSQADLMIDQVDCADPEDMRATLASLRTLLSQRALMVDQMESKLEQGQKILSRCNPLTVVGRNSDLNQTFLNTIISYELEILTAFSFFKHNVEKRVRLLERSPLVERYQLELHNIFYIIILNAIEAMDGVEEPYLEIVVKNDMENTVVTVANRAAEKPQPLEILSKPFYSTKDGHDGVGLYLAQRFIDRVGGRLELEVSSKDTRFRVYLPCEL